MPSTVLKKEDMLELIQMLGIPPTKGTKATLQEILRRKLEQSPDLIELDARLPKLADMDKITRQSRTVTTPATPVASKAGSKPGPKSAASTASSAVKQPSTPSSTRGASNSSKAATPRSQPSVAASSATPALTATPKSAPASAQNPAPKAVAQTPIRSSVSSSPLLQTVAGAETVSAVGEALSEFSAHMSQVRALNEFLLLIELAYFAKVRLSGLVLPTSRSALTRDQRVLVSAAPTAFVWLLTIVVPLIVAYFANFTKRPSIRRKKHAYVIDPLSFGLFRIVTATVLHSLYQFHEHALLTGVAGFVSSLFAIYAALLQTQ